MKKFRIILYFFGFTVIIFTSCKKKCGCENDVEKEITSIQAALRYDVGYPTLTYDFITHEICNKDAIPARFLDSLKKSPNSEIKVLISADFIPSCKDGRIISGPFLKIKSIIEIK